MNAKQRTEYAKWLGSRTSAKKAQASRENGKKGGRPSSFRVISSDMTTEGAAYREAIRRRELSSRYFDDIQVVCQDAKRGLWMVIGRPKPIA